MSDSKPEDFVTLLWDIENINELFTHKIESPVFLSHSLDRTRWKMCLYPKGCDRDADDISLSLTRCSSSKQEVHELVLDCELSIVREKGLSTLVSKQITEHGFVGNHTWSPGEAFVSRDDVFSERWEDFVPYNVLHIRCRLWRSFKKSTQRELLMSNSKVERSLFNWKIDNFSCIKDNEVNEIHIRQSSIEALILSFKFCTDRNSDSAIIEIASDKRFNFGIFCEIAVIASTGSKFLSECQDWSSNDENPYQFPTFIKLSELLDNKALYLPMDVLSLQVDSFFRDSKLDNINYRPLPIPNLQICERFPSAENNGSQGKAENIGPTKTFDKQSMTDTERYLYKPEKSCDREKCDVNPDAHHQTLERFIKDMHCMYKEGLFSDFTLCSGNKTFPVHKTVLSARSPVFKAMFTSPLKEKDGKTLDIPDIDADTLHRMLLFVYSNKIADMEWEDAVGLYFAADKFQIEDLKSITSSVLKVKLSVSNVCEILVNADLHEDQNLKSSAMEFIVNHDDEILGNENWKTFQANYMPLAMEILSALYTTLKKRLE